MWGLCGEFFSLGLIAVWILVIIWAHTIEHYAAPGDGRGTLITHKSGGQYAAGDVGLVAHPFYSNVVSA